MKKLLLILTFIFAYTINYAQVTKPVDVRKNYTKPDFQRSVNVNDTLGVNHLMADTGTIGLLRISDKYILPIVDGTSGQVMKTNGSGTITWGNEAGALQLWEYELTIDDENDLTVSDNLSNTTSVFYNGTNLASDKWSGVGTTTLTLLINRKKYDYIKIKY